MRLGGCTKTRKRERETAQIWSPWQHSQAAGRVLAALQHREPHHCATEQNACKSLRGATQQSNRQRAEHPPPPHTPPRPCTLFTPLLVHAHDQSHSTYTNHKRKKKK